MLLFCVCSIVFTSSFKSWKAQAFIFGEAWIRAVFMIYANLIAR